MLRFRWSLRSMILLSLVGTLAIGLTHAVHLASEFSGVSNLICSPDGQWVLVTMQSGRNVLMRRAGAQLVPVPFDGRISDSWCRFIDPHRIQWLDSGELALAVDSYSASVGQRMTLEIWDPSTNRLLLTLHDHDVSGIHVMRTLDLAVTCDLSRWDFTTLCDSTPRAYDNLWQGFYKSSLEAGIHFVRITDDGHIIAIGEPMTSDDEESYEAIETFSVESMKKINYCPLKANMYVADVSRNGRYGLIQADSSDSAAILDLRTGRISEFRGERSPFEGYSYRHLLTPQGDAAFVLRDNSIQIYDIASDDDRSPIMQLNTCITLVREPDQIAVYDKCGFVTSHGNIVTLWTWDGSGYCTHDVKMSQTRSSVIGLIFGTILWAALVGRELRHKFFRADFFDDGVAQSQWAVRKMWYFAWPKQTYKLRFLRRIAPPGCLSISLVVSSCIVFFDVLRGLYERWLIVEFARTWICCYMLYVSAFVVGGWCYRRMQRRHACRHLTAMYATPPSDRNVSFGSDYTRQYYVTKSDSTAHHLRMACWWCAAGGMIGLTMNIYLMFLGAGNEIGHAPYPMAGILAPWHSLRIAAVIVNTLAVIAGVGQRTSLLRPIAYFQCTSILYFDFVTPIFMPGLFWNLYRSRS